MECEYAADYESAVQVVPIEQVTRSNGMFGECVIEELSLDSTTTTKQWNTNIQSYVRLFNAAITAYKKDRWYSMEMHKPPT